MRSVSMCVPSYNEAGALERLILSSLPASHLLREWVVVDHRSSDATTETLAGLRGPLRDRGVDLRVIREERDFSSSFVMADLRNVTLRACGARVAAMMDADFILGSEFPRVLVDAVEEMTRDPTLAAVRFRIPVIWDNLKVASDGAIMDHGRVWVHPTSNRVLWREAVTYRQDLGNGRWHRPHFRGRRRRTRIIPNDGSVLTSVNVKPPDRIALRETMTYYLEDAKAGSVKGDWLTEYAKGNLRSGIPYKYEPGASLRGVQLNSGALQL